MLQTNGNFHITYKNIYDSILNIYQREVYCFMISCSNKDNYSFPSQKLIGDKIGASRKKVNEVLAELEELGLVVSYTRENSKNRGKGYYVYPLTDRHFPEDYQGVKLEKDLLDSKGNWSTITYMDDTQKFAMIPNVIYDFGLTTIELAVLRYIKCISYEGKSYPYRGTIADKVGISPRSVWRALSSLEEKGLIWREKDTDGGELASRMVFDFDLNLLAKKQKGNNVDLTTATQLQPKSDCKNGEVCGSDTFGELQPPASKLQEECHTVTTTLPHSYTNNTIRTILLEQDNLSIIKNKEDRKTDTTKEDYKDSKTSNKEKLIDTTPFVNGWESYLDKVKDQIDFENVDKTIEPERLFELIAIIAEVLYLPKDYYKIEGRDIPGEIVRYRLSKIGRMEIEYVVYCLDNVSSKIWNIKAYLIAALFNACLTVNNYHQAKQQYNQNYNRNIYRSRGRIRCNYSDEDLAKYSNDLIFCLQYPKIRTADGSIIEAPKNTG
jgi:DNA-binding MarR family transcriptional regulator